MKTKYVIGLLAGLLLIAALLTAGYQISYRHVMTGRQLPQRKKATAPIWTGWGPKPQLLHDFGSLFR